VKLPPQLIAVAGRFDRLSLRERLFVLLAMIAVVIASFNALLTSKLDNRRSQLLSELADLESGMNSAATDTASQIASDPTNAAYTQASELKARLDSVDAQLTAQSAGMIGPKRMAEVIRDVLNLQHGITLVSLRNLPVARLVPDAAGQTSSGPYLHSVELVLDGRYLDVLAYLQSLEALPWHFYWRQLDLTATHYPVNRVRVEVGTISMDSDWLDL
jgi:MSHA biogenesis protein MshJ